MLISLPGTVNVGDKSMIEKLIFDIDTQQKLIRLKLNVIVHEVPYPVDFSIAYKELSLGIPKSSVSVTARELITDKLFNFKLRLHLVKKRLFIDFEDRGINTSISNINELGELIKLFL